MSEFQLETGTPDPNWEEPLPGAASAPPQPGGSAWTGTMYDGIASRLKPLFGQGESFKHKLFVFSYSPHTVIAEVAMVNKQAYVVDSKTSGTIKVNATALGGGGEVTGSADRTYEFGEYKPAIIKLFPPDVSTGIPNMQPVPLHEDCKVAYVTMYKEVDPGNPFFKDMPVKAGRWACVYAGN